MRILCKFVGHHRSRPRAFFYPDQEQWLSYCTRCGVKMVRLPQGGWEVLDE
jgi:hypothetical protein